MNAYELKAHVSAGKDRFFFERDTMRFFGDTMRNYGVRSKPVEVEIRSRQRRPRA